MEFKNKSSQSVQMIVRATSKISSNYYTKKRTHKRDLDCSASPNPIDYYTENLEHFRPRNGWTIALCPFHDDKKPSFAVNTKIGCYVCFSCGARGKSIIGFHAKKHGLSFEQARKALGVIRG